MPMAISVVPIGRWMKVSEMFMPYAPPTRLPSARCGAVRSGTRQAALAWPFYRKIPCKIPLNQRQQIRQSVDPGAGGSFDYLVGDGKQRRRDLVAEDARRLQVEDELELGGLHHRQVGRFLALEDAAGIDADLALQVC